MKKKEVYKNNSSLVEGKEFKEKINQETKIKQENYCCERDK